MKRDRILLAVRLAAYKKYRMGEFAQFKAYRRLLREDPILPDADERFTDLLAEMVETQAEPRGKILDSLIALLQWVLEHWEEIAEIILFVISLFADPTREVQLITHEFKGGGEPEPDVNPYRPGPSMKDDF